MPYQINSRYNARVGYSKHDLQQAQALRHTAFLGGDGFDRDAFDDICTHVLIDDMVTGRLVCCFRMLPISRGADISRSYSAQFYGLAALKHYPGKMVELGRFCVHPDVNDPDILRVAWGAITRYVDENAVELLLGCSSFPGTATGIYHEVFALLKDRYLAPASWAPAVKAPSVFCFARDLQDHKPDMRLAMQRMPPLLQTYLTMGGWVSDHAVVDWHLNTLHVFTGLEVCTIPAARKRWLRALAQQLDAPPLAG